MQGLFSSQSSSSIPFLGTNWGSALDPGMDEATENAVRDARAATNRARDAAAARSGRALPGPPSSAQRVQLDILVPPVSFTIKHRQFYVMKQPEDGLMSPRRGRCGHYLVPCVVKSGTGGPRLAVPYPEKTTGGNAPPIQPRQGAPGKPKQGVRDAQPSPDATWCVEGRDFVCAPASDDADGYWEVGLQALRQRLEEAESMDLAFARRMEGLANVSPTVMWDAIDPEYDPSDREPVMAQFMAKYLEKFYQRLDGGSEPSIEAVSAEAIHKHRVFCKAWAERHYRTLTPVVTAPAEALASEFYAHLEPVMRPRRLTRMELARVLMRHESFAPEFATALHYFMVNLEQTRGSRNSNYKQMRMMTSARVTSYSSLGTLLATNERELHDTLKRLCREEVDDGADFHLHPLIVDWHGILGQIPTVHRHFQEPTSYTGLSAARRATAEGRVPPWRIGRQPNIVANDDEDA